MGDRRNVTRRTLLEGVAAAGAASLMRPADGLASAFELSGPVSSRWVGSLSAESERLRAPRRFSLVGVQWAGPAAATIELRARGLDGGWSPWAIASVLGHDGDREGRREGLFGEPVWTGPAEYVQARSDRPVAGLRLHFVSVTPSGSRARAAQGLPLAQPVLNAGPGQPPIIARQAWALGRARPTSFAGYGTVKLAFVHHTVNPNGYSASEVPALLLAIYDYHVYTRGFFDVAYNFLIDSYGRIWEGRAGGIDMAVVGAQAGGYNTESTGVAIIGDFMKVVPSQAAISALKRLLAWKLSLHGVPAHGRVTVVVNPADYFYTPFGPGAHVSLPRVAGHRDGDLTDCPGNALYGELPSIRARIDALAGTPARLDIAAPTASTAGVAVVLSGRLRQLGGAGLAGAPIELQELGLPGVATTRTTVATATTAADGSWGASVALQRNAALRAVHAQQPAAVTDWAHVSVAPALTLTVQSASPPVVSGTISPPKRQVVVDLYLAGHAGDKPVRHKRVPASGGHFSARLRPPAPGNYVIVAVSEADSANAAGASPQVALTVT